MSTSSLSSSSSDGDCFQGFSIYAADDHDDENLIESTPNCEIRPETSRSFGERVDELLRRRVAECAAASTPSPKRQRLFGHLGSPPPPPPLAVTPGAAPGRERVVSCDDLDINYSRASSSSSFAADSISEEPLSDKAMTPHSRTDSYSKLVTPFEQPPPEAFDAATTLLVVGQRS